jgi:hypothetical protein
MDALGGVMLLIPYVVVRIHPLPDLFLVRIQTRFALFRDRFSRREVFLLDVFSDRFFVDVELPGNGGYFPYNGVGLSDIIDLGHVEHFSFSSFAVVGPATKDRYAGTAFQLSSFLSRFFPGFPDDFFRTYM